MRAFPVFVLLGMLSVLTGCGQEPISNQRLIESFEQGRTGNWVSGQAPVSQVLGDEGIGGLHQRFTVTPNEEIAVTVLHSLEHSERVPVERGDIVRFQGRYEWDARGGTVSHTYSDPDQPGGGGWIEHEGVRYD